MKYKVGKNIDGILLEFVDVFMMKNGKVTKIFNDDCILSEKDLKKLNKKILYGGWWVTEYDI